MSNDQRRDRNDYEIPHFDEVKKGYKPDAGKVPPLPVNTPPAPPPSDSSKNEKK